MDYESYISHKNEYLNVRIIIVEYIEILAIYIYNTNRENRYFLGRRSIFMFDRIYDILIAGGAWITILNGLWATVKISVLSLLLGTILGAVICSFRRSKHPYLRHPATAYIREDKKERGTRGCVTVQLYPHN